MNKIYDTFFDETYYKEKLDNGLEVIIFHKPDYSVTTACFGTPYGALNIHQKFNDKAYDFNPGIAHFLEHKLFESEGKDILNRFSSIGANVNAFTSYKQTVYYFSKSDEDVEECLNLLMDFVQDLSISDESVEKEKGIICEELSMYKQSPDNELINETYKSLYKYYPLNNDIGGTSKTVRKITKAELEECYSINYHPSNMVLLVASPLDPEYIFGIIKNNQDSKNFSIQSKPLVNNKKEPLEVVRRNHDFKMSINTPKTCYAIKLKPDFKDNLDAINKEKAMKIYLSAYFSKLNPTYQEWLDKGIINDYFDFDVDFDMDYAYLLFYGEVDDSEFYKKLIDDELKKDLFNEEILNQMKRGMVGASFRIFSDVEGFACGYIRSYLEGVDYLKHIHELMDLTYEDVTNVYKSFDYSNYSLVHISNK